MTPRERLELAETILQDRALPAWERCAALLARQAIEKAMRRLLARRFAVPERAPFRAQFVALRGAVDPEIAVQAHWTWTALSRATHYHSYALPPTAEELERWLGNVRVLVDASES